MKSFSALRLISPSGIGKSLASLSDPALVQAKRQNEIEVVPFEGV